MKDVMLDFETLGNGKNALVCQVGACYFDRHTGEIGNSIKLNIDAKSAQDSGGEFDADAVYFWLNQTLEARQSITMGEKHDIREAMILLNDFLSSAKSVWSHATFDFVILTETLKRLKIKSKVPYRTARDIRTLQDLVKVDYSLILREGVHHDALADCIFQVKYCVECFKALK